MRAFFSPAPVLLQMSLQGTKTSSITNNHPRNHCKSPTEWSKTMIARINTTNTWPMAAALFALLATVNIAPAQSPKPDLQGPPRIVSTNPKIGETDVKADLNEITVTFDRDMQPGFSWTGGPPDFPPGAEGKKPVWLNKRTCVLPVKLEA